MPIIIPQRFSQRYDTVINWAAKNPVLWAGEIAYGTDGTGKVVSTKVGDGTTSWTGLPEAGGGGVPSGGTTGQIIVKQSATDGDAAWQDPLIQSAGTGIDITSGVISSTLGSIAITNDVANYASLPTLSAGDAGQYWMTRDTGMAYRWNGSAWPSEGSGIGIGRSARHAIITPSSGSYTDSTTGQHKAPFFATVVSDDYSMWDAVNKRFVAPVAGVYAIYAGFRISPNQIANIYIYVNGDVMLFGANQGSQVTADHAASGTIMLAKGDYVEAYLYTTATIIVLGTSDATWGRAQRFSITGPL